MNAARMENQDLPIKHRQIPTLPNRPRAHPIAGRLWRSYPVGRQSFTRACQGRALTLTLTTEQPLPTNIQVSLLTTLNSNPDDVWDKVPFVPTGDKTLTCCIVPEHPGLHSFRAGFSLDGGETWIPDTVPDAQVLIDPPQVDALRVYTLIPTVSGTLADWKADLKRIREMGFNAIHLLPITAMDTSQSPYAASDLFDVDRSYLPEGSQQTGLSQLDEYVEEAKALGVRLCFDLVLNHVGVDSTIARRAPDWIVQDQDQPDGLRRARYWCDDAWRSWDDLVLINYEHPSEAVRSEIRAYMIDYALFWAKYANDTGGFVRFDNLHSSDPEFIQTLTDTLHEEYPELGLLAEYFKDEHTLLETGPRWGLNLLLASPWGYKYVPQLRDYLNYIHRVSECIRYFMPITSHDSGAPAQEFGSADSTAPRYVAAALLGTGATGIPQGVELGEASRIDFIGRQPRMAFPANPRFAEFIGRVNAILAENPAFRRGQNCRFVDGGHTAIVAAFRCENGNKAPGFLVVCNFDIYASQSITVDLTSFLGTDGPFAAEELLGCEAKVFPGPRMDLSLPPCGVQVLRFLGNGGSTSPIQLVTSAIPLTPTLEES
jgi:hypothetical protein